MSREDAFLRHQRMRWLRPDAGRWVREDAARFLRPGSGPAKNVAGIKRKYNRDQPRVPAGNGRESGRWTNGIGGGAGNDVAQPTGSIDFGDLPNFSDLFALFQIAPQEFDNSDSTQLAGDIPDGEGSGIGQNQGPSLEPPDSGGAAINFCRSHGFHKERGGMDRPYGALFAGRRRLFWCAGSNRKS